MKGKYITTLLILACLSKKTTTPRKSLNEPGKPVHTSPGGIISISRKIVA